MAILGLPGLPEGSRGPQKALKTGSKQASGSPGPLRGSKGVKKGQNGQNSPFWGQIAQNGHFGPKMAILGLPGLPEGSEGLQKALKTP